MSNLPRNSTIEELHRIFSQFGVIKDLSLRRRSASKHSKPRPSNCAYVIYYDGEALQKCLTSKVSPKLSFDQTTIHLQNVLTGQKKCNFTKSHSIEILVIGPNILI